MIIPFVRDSCIMPRPPFLNLKELKKFLLPEKVFDDSYFYHSESSHSAEKQREYRNIPSCIVQDL